MARVTLADAPDWAPGSEHDRVIVMCTGRAEGAQIRRLPDRMDAAGSIAAVLVESERDARAALETLDVPGRRLFVDVERKQAPDLMGLARGIVTHAALDQCKPNDTTVAALDALILHERGPDLAGLRCGVLGLGNLGFKTALLLAERNASVVARGRDDAKVSHLVEALNLVLPRHSAAPVRVWSDEVVDVLVGAASGRGCVDESYLALLAPNALVIDLGIDNLAPSFVAEALAAGHRLARVDTRAGNLPLRSPAPGFFDEVYGAAEVAGIRVVAGGVVGERGDVIVDRVVGPRSAYGLANGTGGVLRREDWTDENAERFARVDAVVRAR